MNKNKFVLLMTLAIHAPRICASELNTVLEDQVQALYSATEVATVLSELAESNPDLVEKIMIDESNLKTTFQSIQHFINKRLHEINSLLAHKKDVSFQELSRLAIELADAQAALEKTITQHLARYKKHNSIEKTIKESLKQTELKLKQLSMQSTNTATDFKIFMANHIQQAKNKINKLIHNTEQSAKTPGTQEALEENQEQIEPDFVQPTKKSSSKNKYVIKKLAHQSKNKNQVANSADFQALENNDEIVVVQLAKDGASNAASKKHKLAAKKKAGAKQ